MLFTREREDIFRQKPRETHLQAPIKLLQKDFSKKRVRTGGKMGFGRKWEP